jgi:hypothetical protein
MDPNFDKLPGLNLPQPLESAPSPSGSGENMPPAAEAMPVAGEQIPAVPTAPTLAPALPGTPPTSAVPLQSPTTPGVDNAAVATPAAADDTDLIEKEWVNKAKQIVEKTRDDPYNQSKELTKFKAEYMQKRYNKALKLSE